VPGPGSTFGERLTYAKDAKRWNDARLASEAGLSPGGVSRHLKQAHPAKWTSVDRYATALQVNPEWLQSGHGPMHASAGVIPAPGAPDLNVPAEGLVALKLVLDSYEWPSGMVAGDLDAISRALHDEAGTPDGAIRSRSIWKVLLDERVRQARRRPSGTMAKIQPPDEPPPGHTTDMRPGRRRGGKRASQAR
jgi:hypothetical protein